MAQHRTEPGTSSVSFEDDDVAPTAASGQFSRNTSANDGKYCREILNQTHNRGDGISRDDRDQFNGNWVKVNVTYKLATMMGATANMNAII